VDNLLGKGVKVRGATRSLAKGVAMIKARPQHSGLLDFVKIDDFESPGGLETAVQDVDAIVHTASVRGNHPLPESQLIVSCSLSHTILQTMRGSSSFPPSMVFELFFQPQQRTLRSAESFLRPPSLP
jgi:nucleoside-diphosphate-sugar epimerase